MFFNQNDLVSFILSSSIFYVKIIYEKPNLEILYHSNKIIYLFFLQIFEFYCSKIFIYRYPIYRIIDTANRFRSHEFQLNCSFVSITHLFSYFVYSLTRFSYDIQLS